MQAVNEVAEKSKAKIDEELASKRKQANAMQSLLAGKFGRIL